MKKKYYSPICDRVFSEEELLNVDSNWHTGNNNPENTNPGGLEGNVDNGEGGGGTVVQPGDVGAKGSPIWDF